MSHISAEDIAEGFSPYSEAPKSIPTKMSREEKAAAKAEKERLAREAAEPTDPATGLRLGPFLQAGYTLADWDANRQAHRAARGLQMQPVDAPGYFTLVQLEALARELL